mmetsp:Transcript_21238/g.24445  ORF Transcript_21238/g.24445 Transcript_21238/m.24445 type:complete len:221 (-) Transcript_21238:251-913(-)
MVLALESKKTTVEATSAGLSILPRGTPLSASSNHFSFPLCSLWSECSFSVRHQPIFTPFTRMPFGANSAALFLVRVTNADLAQLYPMMNGAPPLAATEQMLTIDPRMFFSINCFAAPCDMRKGARTLIANWRSKDSGVVDMRLPREVTAAAFTTPVIGPMSFMASAALGTTDWASSALDRSARTNFVVHVSELSSIMTDSALFAERDTRTRPLAPFRLSW